MWGSNEGKCSESSQAQGVATALPAGAVTHGDVVFGTCHDKADAGTLGRCARTLGIGIARRPAPARDLCPRAAWVEGEGRETAAVGERDKPSLLIMRRRPGVTASSLQEMLPQIGRLIQASELQSRVTTLECP